MKNVLVLMHDDAGQEARLQCALDLTRALDGHLTCLDVTTLPIAAGDDIMLGGHGILLAEERERERENRERIEPRLAKEDAPYSWKDVTGDLAASLCDAAGMNDVIVVNRQLDDKGYPDMFGTAAETILKSGRPVLAVPAGVRGFDAFGHAMVAWDASREAGAALRAAIPLLQMADRVTLLEVIESSVASAAFEAAEYLSRHQVKAVVCRKSATSERPGTLILDEVNRAKASYLVMGGFGHSRWVQAMLGGVSRRMLRESPVPLFMAH